MKLKYGVALLGLVVAFVPLSLFAENGATQAVANREAARVYANLPLSFEPAVTAGHYVARSGAYSVLVAASESSIAVTDANSSSTQILRFSFDGSNATAQIEAVEPLPGVTNYYVGQDASKWRLGVRNFAKLRTKSVYPGVDAVYYGDNRRLEFDFVVAPLADPRPITLKLSGMDKLYIDADGDLVAEVNGRPIHFAKPYAYQRVAGGKKPVTAAYTLAGAGKAQLQIGDYDKNLELVIDPTLSYSTYLGGSLNDTANGIAVDAAGNAYITGQTCSINQGTNPVPFPGVLPTASNNTGTTFSGGTGACDAFVTKLAPASAAGTTVLFTTIFAGTSPATSVASGNGIALDDLVLNPNPVGALGTAYVPPRTNVYVVGSTNFHDLPGAGTYSGGDHDAFIVILDSSNGSLIRSAYLGGGKDDQGYAIAVDSQQNVVVAGQTNSPDFPVYNGFEPKTEEYVAFVTKLDFGLHIPTPAALPLSAAPTLPYFYGASAMTPRPPSATDACGSPPSLCPATPGESGTYYFFSALYSGQLVPPLPTWPVNPATGAIIGAYPVTPALIAGYNNSSAPVPPCPAGSAGYPCIPPAGYSYYVPVPQFAITVATPSCPSLATQTNYPNQVLIALGSGLAEGLNWGNCSSFTVNSSVPDYGGFNWMILGPPVAATYATTEGYGVALDPGGDVFAVGGSTTASLEPANLIFPGIHYAGTGAWIIKMLGRDTRMGSGDAGSPVYLTALGTNATTDGGQGVSQNVNTARAVAVDNEGRAYVVGTASGGIFTSTGSMNPAPISKTYNAFILRMSPSGSGIEYSTYLGGSGTDQGLGVAVDSAFYAYVAGSTMSADIPLRNAIIDASGNTLVQLEGTQNAYLAKVSPDGSELIMSAYLGGSVVDQANGIAVDRTGTGDIYVAGNTTSSNFPVKPLASVSTPLPGLTSYVNNGNAFVTMISGASFPKITASPTSLNFPDQAEGWSSTAAQVQTVTLKNTGTATLNFIAALGGSGAAIAASNDFSVSSSTCGTPPNAQLLAGNSCVVTVTFKPSGAGTRSGVLTITDDASDSPQTVGLKGNGVLVQDSVSQTSLTFASTALGTTSAAQTVTVTNTDPTQILLMSSVITSTSTATTAEFSVSSNNCITNLTPGQSCTIGVTFTPSLPGSQLGTLIINGNGTTFPAVLQLTGTGNGAGSTSGTGTTTTTSFSWSAGSTGPFAVTKGTAMTVPVSLVPPTAGFTGNVILACAPTNICSLSATGSSSASGGTSSGSGGTSSGSGGTSSSSATGTTVNVMVSGTTPVPVTITINIAAGNTVLIGGLIKPGHLLATLLPFGGIGLVLVGRRRRWLVALGLVLCLALGMLGCGGGSTSSSSGNTQNVTVTATPQTGTAPPPLVIALSVQ